MIACVIGLVGMFFIKESSGRNLLGSMPAVENKAEVADLVDTQLENEKLDTSTMPIPQVRLEKAAEAYEAQQGENPSEGSVKS